MSQASDRSEPVAEQRLNSLSVATKTKMLKSMLRSAEGCQAIQDVFGLKVEFVNGPTLATSEAKPVVAVLVPTRDVPKRAMQEAFQEMSAYSRPFADVFAQPAQAGGMIHWNRNALLVNLYKTGKYFDYVLLIDDDMKPGKDDLIKLLAHEKDVISAGTVGRSFPNLPTFKFWNQEQFDAGFTKPGVPIYGIPAEWQVAEGQAEGLLEVAAIGAGMAIYSRKALEAAGEYYLSCTHEQKYMGMTADFAKTMSEMRREAYGRTGNAWWFECLKSPNGEDEIGEDTSMGFKLFHMGIESYVDTSVQTGHVGEYSYTLQDFYINRDLLRREREKGAAA